MKDGDRSSGVGANANGERPILADFIDEESAQAE